MSLSLKPADLLALARSRSPDDRERLLLSIADLCDASSEAAQGDVKALLNDVFLTIAAQAERDLRRTLAERIASAEWAPRALVDLLALDEIDIARPILAASPVLTDEALMRVVIECTVEHQIEIARRPSISSRVSDLIIDRSEPAVLGALLDNETAEISASGMTRLVDASRRIAALRAPLVRHPCLSRMLAERMYAWVGESLRMAIVTRFKVDAAALDRALGEAVRIVYEEGPAPNRAMRVDRSGRNDESDRRLIDKLRAADQLRPGFLVRALREDKLSLFEHGVAAIGGFTVESVRAAVASAAPERLALACAAVGLDRAVFATVLAGVRRLNGGSPSDDPALVETAMTAFSASTETAAEQFRGVGTAA
jgi:uncharacterized protein (DUF2336 family)